jgi:3-oxoacyl-[acyl-carrier protein] reductase
MVDGAISAFGRLDFLVNNVSQRGQCPLLEMTFDLWQSVLSSTLNSAFLCTKAALPHLIASGGGAVVNIGGVASHAGFPERAHVAAAKAGLCGMTAAPPAARSRAIARPIFRALPVTIATRPFSSPD